MAIVKLIQEVLSKVKGGLRLRRVVRSRLCHECKNFKINDIGEGFCFLGIGYYRKVENKQAEYKYYDCFKCIDYRKLNKNNDCKYYSKYFYKDFVLVDIEEAEEIYNNYCLPKMQK